MFALWRNSKRPGKEKERKGNLAVLERKTADIREKLSRLSLGSGFRRHSAPAQPSQSSGNDCDEGIHYGSISRERSVDPVVLSQLPVPILELILERLSLKVYCGVSAWQQQSRDENDILLSSAERARLFHVISKTVVVEDQRHTAMVKNSAVQCPELRQYRSS